MYPYLFNGISLYAAFIGVGVALGVFLGINRLRAAGLELQRCVVLQLALVAAGLTGAKLYAIVERGHVLALLDETTGSLRYPGGLIAAAGVLFVFRKSLLQGVSLAALADAIAPATAVAVAVARLGCFASGCCFGIRTGLPWSVQFPAQSPAWQAHVAARWLVSAAPVSLPVHPLQLYFAVASAAVAVVVLWYEPHARYHGQSALIFVALDGLSKGLLEMLRGEPQPNLQVAAFALASAALAVLLIVAWRRRLAAPVTAHIAVRSSPEGMA